MAGRAIALTAAALLTAACAPALPGAAGGLAAEEYLDLGVGYYARGRYDLAALAFQRALERRPGWTRALVNLGDARLAAGDLEAAIAAYGAARALSPGDPAIANNLAWALLQHAERWREAEPVIREALGAAPEPRGYYLDTLGVLLLRKEQPQDALAAFRAALADPGLRDPPTRALVLRHAANALERLGDAAGAERCFRAAGEVVGRRAASPGGPPTPAKDLATEVGPGEGVC